MCWYLFKHVLQYVKNYCSDDYFCSVFWALWIISMGYKRLAYALRQWNISAHEMWSDFKNNYHQNEGVLIFIGNFTGSIYCWWFNVLKFPPITLAINKAMALEAVVARGAKDFYRLLAQKPPCRRYCRLTQFRAEKVRSRIGIWIWKLLWTLTVWNIAFASNSLPNFAGSNYRMDLGQRVIVLI